MYYTPSTMTWAQVTHAPDEELVAAYMVDGTPRTEAEELVAKLRNGGLDWLVGNTPEYFRSHGMNPGPGEYVLWDMKETDLTAAEVIETKFPSWR